MVSCNRLSESTMSIVGLSPEAASTPEWHTNASTTTFILIDTLKYSLIFPLNLLTDLLIHLQSSAAGRYYRAPRYFFTVRTVAQNCRYCPSLLSAAVAAVTHRSPVNSDASCTCRRLLDKSRACLHALVRPPAPVLNLKFAYTRRRRPNNTTHRFFVDHPIVSSAFLSTTHRRVVHAA